MNTTRPLSLPLRLTRHFVALFLVSFLNPFTLNNIEPLISAFYIFAGTTIWTAIFFGLYFLFFTEKAKKSWPRGFIVTAWLFITLVMIGYWQPIDYLKKSLDSHNTHTQSRKQNTIPPTKTQEEISLHLAQQGDTRHQENACWEYSIKEDWDKAKFWCQLSANKGIASAQLNLGYMYDNGLGTKTNHSEALRWYKLSADQKNLVAQYNLGIMYKNGHGTKQNYTEAIRWLLLSAQQGLSEAQYNLGNMYQNGQGVEQNNKEAIYWYLLAAEQNNTPAQIAVSLLYLAENTEEKDIKQAIYWLELAAKSNSPLAKWAQTELGNLYFNGIKVEQNYAESMLWYKLAAKQGDEFAQYAIGFMYEDGYGVIKNQAEAKYWYQLAAKQGYKAAQEGLARLR